MSAFFLVFSSFFFIILKILNALKRVNTNYTTPQSGLMTFQIVDLFLTGTVRSLVAIASPN